jgi:hypothetical protein
MNLREAAMPKWRLAGEPSLDELLDDEVMVRVMRRAGLDAIELRRRLAEIAGRLRDCRNSSRRGGRGAAFG